MGKAKAEAAIMAEVVEEVNLVSNISSKAIFNVDIAKNLAIKKLNVGANGKMKQGEPTLPRKSQRKVICSWPILQSAMTLTKCGSWIVAVQSYNRHKVVVQRSG